MKNILLNLLSEKGSKTGAGFMKRRTLINEWTKNEALTEYNPKTARHKSLKNVSIFKG